MAEAPSDRTSALPKTSWFASAGLLARLGTAAILSPLLIAIVRWPDPRGWFIAIALAMVLGLCEYLTMVGATAGERAFGMTLGLGYAVGLYGGASPELLVAGLLLLGLGVPLIRLGGEPQQAARQSRHLFFGVVYVGLLLFAALLKRDMGPRGGAWVFLLLTITWIGDTFAYAAGRLLGRHKLYPKVSPAKTWEGMIGGVLGSVAAAALAHAWYLPELGWTGVVAVAIPGSLLGQMGDLCESMIKRAHGVKDSGRLLPGHGGVLDRIDALLFVAPWIYLYARWLM